MVTRNWSSVLEQMMYDWSSLGCQWFRRRIIKKGAGKAREKNRDRENLRSLSDETPALQEGDQVIDFFFNPFPRIRLIDQGSRLTV